MRIAVIGGAGFIGSHISIRAISIPEISEIIIYDNFSSGTRLHLIEVIKSPKTKVIEGDIKHLGLLTHSLRGVDLVIHLAANPDISKAIKKPDIDFWEGTYLTQNVLEAMRINGVRKILYTSGSGVYGEDPQVAFSEDYGCLRPISTYGASKLACEVLISSYCYMFEMQGRAFRFANVVGPKQTHGVGYDFIRRLISDPARLKILGDGSQSKSYIHVSDVVDAMLLVLGEMDVKNKQPFDVYNVATDDYISVTEIADIACEVAGLRPTDVLYEYTGGDRGWKGDVPKVTFNVKKIKGLGWRASMTSFEALRSSIRSMKCELGSSE